MALYSVYVAKLPLSTTKRQLINLFTPTSPVADAYVCANTGHVEYTYGFVRFLKLEEAKKVIAEWDGAMYKEQRLLVEMSRHGASNSMDAGGGRGRGGRRPSGVGRGDERSNWQDLYQTWEQMKTGDESGVHWSTLVKELAQIEFSLVPPYFVDDDKANWSYSAGDLVLEGDSVSGTSPPLCSRDTPQCSNERPPEAGGGDANSWNSHVSELARPHFSPTAGLRDRQDTADSTNSGRVNERRNFHTKSDSDLCRHDHRAFNSSSRGLPFHGHQRSQSSRSHDDSTQNSPSVKLVSIGRGKMLSVQIRP